MVRTSSWLVVFAALLLSTVRAEAVPPNDECNGAIEVTLPAFSDLQDTDDATVTPGDPPSTCSCSSNANSVWYTVAPTDDSTVVARTIGSAYDTVLDVLEGTCGAAKQVGCSNNFGGTVTSQLTFSACAGRTYLVRVMDSCAEGGGSMRLEVSSTPGALDRDADGVHDCADNCPARSNATQVDTDADGVGDLCDNCPIVFNPDQADTIPGGGGDACQNDFDGDGVLDGNDNCRNVVNPDQADADADTRGDACDVCPGLDDRPNADGDAVPDACDPCTDVDNDGFGSPGFPATTCALDNCPTRSNPGQQDGNTNGIGDACDDRDGDGDFDAADNCVDVPNADQSDADRDATGNACDTCTDPDEDGFGSPGFPASLCTLDNCPATPNADQLDTDADGKGDACFVCTALGAAAHFPTISATKIRTKQIVSDQGFYALGTVFTGPVCTVNAVFQGTSVERTSSDVPGLLVATASRGNAVSWSPHKDRTGDYDIEPENEVRDALVTGGGQMRGQMDAPPALIDTTGNRPEVADCRAAITTLQTASATLAAMPPRLTLGDVFVRKDEVRELDLRGGGVVQMSSLSVEGTLVRSAGDDDPRSCDEDGGRLRLRVDPGDQLVVNVTGKFNIGNCSFLSVEDGTGIPALVLINVPGLGTRVRFGVAAAAYRGVNVLAPRRKIEVVGDGSGVSAEFGRIMGKKLLLRGFAFQTDTDENICP